MADTPPGGGPVLILVKHALPEIVPGVPAAEWRLSVAGRARCAALAAALAPYAPARLVSSVEPKAAETAALAAAALGIPHAPAPDLHEHDRAGVPFLDPADFEAAVAALFATPDRLVFGRETAAAAATRFRRAVAGVLDAHPGESLAVVAHGTVIALYVAAVTGAAALPLWQRLGLPAFVVLARATGALLAEVDSLA